MFPFSGCSFFFCFASFSMQQKNDSWHATPPFPFFRLCESTLPAFFFIPGGTQLVKEHLRAGGVRQTWSAIDDHCTGCHCRSASFTSAFASGVAFPVAGYNGFFFLQLNCIIIHFTALGAQATWWQYPGFSWEVCRWWHQIPWPEVDIAFWFAKGIHSFLF